MQEFGTGSLAELVRSAHAIADRSPGVPAADGGYEGVERAAARVARAVLAVLPHRRVEMREPTSISLRKLQPSSRPD